nr:MAG TPA: hypothetical protein [Caudoviricetes sp.]
MNIYSSHIVHPSLRSVGFPIFLDTLRKVPIPFTL